MEMMNWDVQPEKSPIVPMVGYAYVPIQNADFRNLYSPEMGFERGTIFPILDKPLGVYGKQTGTRRNECND